VSQQSASGKWTVLVVEDDILVRFKIRITGGEPLVRRDIIRLFQEAALENSQIRWIGTDPDVSAFFQKIVEPRLDKYPKERQAEIAMVFELSDDEHQDEDDNDSGE